MGRFRILRPLGVGGMAEVYRADWLLPYTPRIPVALKLMRQDFASVATRSAVAGHEALVGLRLTHNHPNLVSVFDVFEDNEGRLFLVMELVEGGTVSDFVRVYDHLPYAVIRRIARALVAARRRSAAWCRTGRDRARLAGAARIPARAAGFGPHVGSAGHRSALGVSRVSADTAPAPQHPCTEASLLCAGEPPRRRGVPAARRVREPSAPPP